MKVTLVHLSTSFKKIFFIVTSCDYVTRPIYFSDSQDNVVGLDLIAVVERSSGHVFGGNSCCLIWLLVVHEV